MKSFLILLLMMSGKNNKYSYINKSDNNSERNLNQTSTDDEIFILTFASLDFWVKYEVRPQNLI